MTSRLRAALKAAKHERGEYVLCRNLRVVVPANTPSCCKRHARNTVRHEGCAYDDHLAGMARGSAYYERARDEVNSLVDEALVEAERMPAVEDCCS